MNQCVAKCKKQNIRLSTSVQRWIDPPFTSHLPRPPSPPPTPMQVSITDYVVFDQGSLFQTLIHATQSVATATRAPVNRVAECLRVAFLSQHSQCQPSLVSTNGSGVWIASGRNDFHVAKGSLIGRGQLKLNQSNHTSAPDSQWNHDVVQAWIQSRLKPQCMSVWDTQLIERVSCLCCWGSQPRAC